MHRSIKLTIALGNPEDRATDMLGRVYEYFLSQLASAEGKKGGIVLWEHALQGWVVAFNGRRVIDQLADGGLRRIVL